MFKRIPPTGLISETLSFNSIPDKPAWAKPSCFYMGRREGYKRLRLGIVNVHLNSNPLCS